MKIKFLAVIIGTFFLAGCASKPNNEVEEFKLNLSSEQYTQASEIYKENKENEEFKKYADEFIDNDIKSKEAYLNKKNYVAIEEDLDIISEFYNSKELINAKDKIKDIKIELSLENKKLADKNTKLEDELKELKAKITEEENLKNGVFEYKNYLNERWKFSIEYPSFFDEIVVNGDNINVHFTSTTYDGTIILDGWNREETKSIDELFAEELANIPDMPYKEKHDDSYVISWREGELICYKTVLVGAHSMNSFIMKYPESEKAFYNPILENIYASFKPGDLSRRY